MVKVPCYGSLSLLRIGKINNNYRLTPVIAINIYDCSVIIGSIMCLFITDQEVILFLFCNKPVEGMLS